MSYDLFFRSRPGFVPINEATFGEYFSRRLDYTIQNGRQAWYSNEDTGVYFSFELSDPEDDPEEPSDAAFNMNFYRPHIFALEAEPEVASFIAAFNPVVADPQVSGMGESGYSRDAFLSGWNAGNEFGYSAVTEQPGADLPQVLPSAVIERFWRWNLARRGTQEGAGESIFVPRIVFLRSDPGIASFVVWGDAIPILLPEVDFVVIVRDELAPRGFFRRKKDLAMAPWAQVLPAISSYKTSGQDLAYWTLDYTRPPDELVSWIKGLAPYSGQLSGITVDQILDQELIARVKAT